jgi:hypothetical protein
MNELENETPLQWPRWWQCLPMLAKEGSLELTNLMNEIETKLTIIWTKE